MLDALWAEQGLERNDRRWKKSEKRNTPGIEVETGPRS